MVTDKLKIYIVDVEVSSYAGVQIYVHNKNKKYIHTQ